jgi:hypothetical protein
MAGHRYSTPGRLSPHGRLRDLPAGSIPLADRALNAWVETGGIRRPVMVVVTGDSHGSPGRDPSKQIRVLAPPPSPGRARHAGPHPRKYCSCRYGWSWPEPPAGETSHYDRSPRAPSKTGACGQPGSRTANRMAGHRALPLGSGRTSRGLDQHGQQVNSRNSECMRRKG